ncbi:hypothetical protein NE237_022734 [Protea cynaroides]|uniref:Disease resistance protein RPS4B/Roq1-like leucine-rich repeats domain-containing protein n=1 Tax=Protea cynaroides TaxID=273540 RepID=A0A9Q0K5J6_9MAGN|nr:hypothetical protein NE237_022734 [Protea cynaroides]
MFNSEDVSFSIEAFANMCRMRLLQLNYVHLKGGYEHFPKDLRWLCWHGFHLNSIPSNFDMENVVILDMRNSNIKEVWKGIKPLRRLKILNLSNSRHLKKSPNFIGLPNLERLILKGCTSLVEVHESIGFLDKLVVLNLKHCKNLRNLPSSISKLGSLEVLNLFGCSRQVKSNSLFSFFQILASQRKNSNPFTLVPSFSCLYSLRDLNLSFCNLSEGMIPNDIGGLSSLKQLSLSGNSFRSLPASISRLSRLGILNMRGCGNLQLLPDLPSSLGTLDLEYCSSLESLPANMSDLSHLLSLTLDGCRGLRSPLELPSSIGYFGSSGCTSLEVLNLASVYPSLQDLRIDYNRFSSLSDQIDHLTELISVTLDGYPRTRSLPKFPSSLKALFIEGNSSMELTKQILIQSLATSQSIGSICMRGCHHLENILRKKSLFQEIYRSFEVIGRGSEIPEWIRHQSMGSSISFEVSPHSGCMIQGLDISALFATDREGYAFSSSLLICNKSKGIQWDYSGKYWPRPSLIDQDLVWVGHVPVAGLPNYFEDEVGFRAHFEVGDQVEVSVKIEVDDVRGARVQMKNVESCWYTSQMKEKPIQMIDQ